MPKRRYRFIAPVEPARANGQEAAADAGRGPVTRKWLLLTTGREKLAWVVLGLIFLAFVLLPQFRRGSGNVQRPVLRSSLLPSPSTWFLPYNFAISSDGKRLAFVAMDRTPRLW